MRMQNIGEPCSRGALPPGKQDLHLQLVRVCHASSHCLCQRTQQAELPGQLHPAARQTHSPAAAKAPCSPSAAHEVLQSTRSTSAQCGWEGLKLCVYGGRDVKPSISLQTIAAHLQSQLLAPANYLKTIRYARLGSRT